MEYKVCEATKHKWVRGIDSDYCKICHSTRMKINNIYRYYDVDGNQYTLIDTDGGEKALAEVEAERKRLRKKEK